MNSEKCKRYFKDSATETTQDIIRNTFDGQKENDSSKKKRIRFTIKEKASILKELETNKTKDICAKYGMGERTLREWRQNQDNIKKAYRDDKKLNLKSIKNTTGLDNAVYVWLLDCQSKGIPNTGPIIKRKAINLNKELDGREDFKASDGWLASWKERKKVRFLKMTGEKLSADVDAAKFYKEEFEKIIKTNHLCRSQVFNFDESGLLIKQVPNKTLVTKDVSQASGTKKQLERVTIAACCNADGSFKLPLVLIGKSKNPRCLDKDKSKLPVWYTNQNNAWMDKTIFTEWFLNEFVPKVKEMLRSKNLPLTAILLVDNCKAHKFVKVGNIKVSFFPPNVTSLIQPLDQGLLQTVKLKYQSSLVSELLVAQQNNMCLIEYLKSVKLDRVIQWVSEAWSNIKPITVYKCWKNLWPIDKKDASTQTDLEEFYSLDFSLDSSVGFESSNTDIDRSNENIQGLLNLIQKLKGYEGVKAEDILHCLNKRLREIDVPYLDEEIIAEVNEDLHRSLNTSEESKSNESEYFLNLSSCFEILYNE